MTGMSSNMPMPENGDAEASAAAGAPAALGTSVWVVVTGSVVSAMYLSLLGLQSMAHS